MRFAFLTKYAYLFQRARTFLIIISHPFTLHNEKIMVMFKPDEATSLLGEQASCFASLNAPIMCSYRINDELIDKILRSIKRDGKDQRHKNYRATVINRSIT